MLLTTVNVCQINSASYNNLKNVLPKNLKFEWITGLGYLVKFHFQATLQFCFIKPLMAALTLILEATNNYGDGDFRFSSFISTLLLRSTKHAKSNNALEHKSSQLRDEVGSIHLSLVSLLLNFNGDIVMKIRCQQNVGKKLRNKFFL